MFINNNHAMRGHLLLEKARKKSYFSFSFTSTKKTLKNMRNAINCHAMHTEIAANKETEWSGQAYFF